MSDNTLRSEKWRRLERVIKWTGLSINSFALTIGLKRSENLYQIKKGNNGISRDLAELITAKYPSVSKGWLLTGEGEMLIGNKAVTGSGRSPITAWTRPWQSSSSYRRLFSISTCPFSTIAT